MGPVAPVLMHRHPIIEREARTLSARLRQLQAAVRRWRVPMSVRTSPVFWVSLASAISFALTYSLFFLPMISPAIEGFTANAEIFMALPAAVSILTLMRAYSAGWSLCWLALSGALI